ncbi:MAG: hypothetical protein HXL33_08480 [Prevotellaceae bacterium]|nr:hypothetical protein [Prevotellaceae bacterium]
MTKLRPIWCKGHCSTAVSSVYGGRRTICMTTVNSAYGGRRTMRKTM